VKATIPVGRYPCSMAATSDGARVYVRNYISRTLSVIDTKMNRVVDTIPVRKRDPFEVTIATEATGTMGDSRFSKTAAGVWKLDAMEYSRSEPSRKTASKEKAEELALLDGKKVAKCRPMGIREIVAWVVVVIILVVGTVLLLTKHGDGSHGDGSHGDGESPPEKCTMPVAYVASWDGTGGTVSVINATSRNELLSKKISVEKRPFAIAITPNGERAYVTNLDSGSVSVIDTAKSSILLRIPVFRPTGVVISPDSTRAYVTSHNPSGNNSEIIIIDTSVNWVVSNISLNVSDRPAGIVITPNGARVYVVYFSQHRLGLVSVVNISERIVQKTIPVGYDPYGIAITPDGTQVYVINQGINSTYARNATVFVIDTATNQVKKIIPIADGYFPTGVAVSPDGERVYVKNTGLSSTVTVIETVDNSVIKESILVSPVGSDPESDPESYGRVAVSTDGTWVYVTTGRATDDVRVINSATNVVMLAIPQVGYYSSAIATALIPWPC
jgi:YVTN family beta-propeller protein